MAHTENVMVHGVSTPCTVLDSSAQEIDDAVVLAKNAVNKAGDTMTGNLNVDGRVIFYNNASTTEGGELILSAPGANSAASGITVDTMSGQFRVFGVPSADGTTRTGVGSIFQFDPYDMHFSVGGYNILHTGNKPTGSYTGNGDATSRTIETGGVGKVCLIYSAYGIVIATPNGAQYFGLSTQAYGPLSVYFSDGTLSLVDGTNHTNGSGVTYYYQVL